MDFPPEVFQNLPWGPQAGEVPGWPKDLGMRTWSLSLGGSSALPPGLWWGCRVSETPYAHLHLFLCQGNDLPILVSQLSWNSKVGNFISVAEFENNSSDAVWAVNGQYRCCVGPGFLQPPGVQLLLAALPLLVAVVSTDHSAMLHMWPPRWPGEFFRRQDWVRCLLFHQQTQRNSGLTLLSFVNQRQVGNYRL